MANITTGPPRGVRPPPPGVVPNFVNPENQTPENIALHTTMLFFSTISLLVRMYTRTFITHQLGLDDALCIIGYGFTCAYSGFLLAAVAQGFIGHHIWDLQLSAYLKGAKLELIARFVFLPAAAFIKLSCMVFYRRFLVRGTTARWICICGIVFIISGYLAFFLESIFACRPVAKRFNSSIPGTCLDPNIGAYGSGALNVVTNIFVVSFPFPIIWQLRMKLSKRLKTMVVFALGIGVIAMSITRTALTPLLFVRPDGTWFLSKFDVYPVVELNIGLICVCCLTFPPFLDRFIPGAWSSRSLLLSGQRSTSQTAAGTGVKPESNSRMSEDMRNGKHTKTMHEMTEELGEQASRSQARFLPLGSASTLQNKSVVVSSTIV